MFISHPSNLAAGASHVAGKAVFGDLVVTKTVDRADPSLTLACAEGKYLGEAELQLCRTDGLPYMSIILEQVMVSSVTYNGVSGSDETIPTVTVTISYKKITWQYTEYDTATGRPTANIERCWNVEKNIEE